MNKVIEAIERKLGSLYRLCPPLEGDRLVRAEEELPEELAEVLKVSDGIHQLMEHPKAGGGEPFAAGSIIYPFEEIVSQTKVFRELYGAVGTVFAGNGAGGYFVLGADGAVYLYEYVGEEGEYYAEDICGYIEKWF